MPKRAVIIGAGKIGNAIAKLIKPSGAVTDLWDKDATKAPNQKSIGAIVPQADVLFFCLPSWHMREAVMSILPHLSKKTPIVSVAKGMEFRSKQTMDELYDELLPRGQGYALLYGPMLADEIERGLMSAAVVAAKRRATCDVVRGLFAKSNLRLEYSADVHGVALSGALKNVYAISLGIVDALEMGGNAKGWFVWRIVNEMAGVLKRLNRGRSEAALGLAGLGDLVCTGFSQYSTNHRVGQELVTGRGLTRMSEGLVSLSSLFSRLGSSAARFPLLMATERVVVGKKNAKREFERFARGR